MIYQIESLFFNRISANAQFTLAVPNLKIGKGDQIALLGPSGCGKSTLLDILSLIALPDSAKRFDFSPTPENRMGLTTFRNNNKTHNKLAHIRKHYIGYILQTGGLLPFLDIRSNIKICQDLTGRKDEQWLTELTQYLGIDRHLNKKPATLSTGERQRVAVARALAHKPCIVIADEPTAALDPENADRVLALLVSLTQKSDTTLLLATHDADRLKKFNFKKISQKFKENKGPEKVTSIFEN